MTETDAIRLLLADVDGTLVTPDKELTDRAVDAVRRLGDAGILFAITSGRPPRGMSMLIEPLNLTTPIAAFNGGLLVNRDMSVVEQRVLPEELVVPVADLIRSFGLDTWVYRGPDWYVPDPHGSHVARESSTVTTGSAIMWPPPVPSPTTSTSPTRRPTRARSPATCPRGTRSRRKPSPRSATCRTTC